MIVVVVRDEHDVDRRQRVEVEPGRHETARTDPLKRRRAVAPHGIGQDVERTELQKYRRMADPCHGTCSVRRARMDDTRLAEWKRSSAWARHEISPRQSPANELFETMP